MFKFINNLFSYCFTNVSFLVKLCYHVSWLPEYPQSRPHSYILFISFCKTGKKMQLSNLCTANEFCPCCIWIGEACSWSHCLGLISEHFCPLSFDSLYRLNFQDMLLGFIISWMHTSVLYFKNPAGFLRIKKHILLWMGLWSWNVRFCYCFYFLLRSLHIPFYPKALKY